MDDKLYAKIGLHLIEKHKVEKIESLADNVDDAIVEAADKDTIVATSDKELKKRLREKFVKIVNLRKKQYLKIE
jgi:rRNA-processing protein FCF1